MRIGSASLKYDLFLMLFVQKTFIFSFLTDFVDLKYVMWQTVFEISRFPYSSTYDLALDARNSCLKVLQMSLLSEQTLLEGRAGRYGPKNYHDNYFHISRYR